MLLTPSFKVMLVRPVSANALSPMLVTLFGIVMLESLWQLLKVLLPMAVTPFPSVTLSKSVQ